MAGFGIGTRFTFPFGGGSSAGSLLLAGILERLMKSQFQSTEKLRVRLPPFLNKIDWSYIMGTDTCTIKIKCPDGALLTSGSGGVPAASYDSDVKMWILDLDVSQYTAHHHASTDEWKIYAESNDANMVPQWASHFWGDYVDDTSDILTQLSAIGSNVTILKKISTGRWRVTMSNQFLIYDTDGVTVLYRFDLADIIGLPTRDNIYERTPV